MAQRVQRRRRKQPKRKLKKTFLAFVAVLAVVALILVSNYLIIPAIKSIFTRNPLGESGISSNMSTSSDSSDISSENSSNVSSTISIPESSNISVLPPSSSFSPTQSYLGGNYLNVGTSYVVEVIDYEAETFDGKTKNDNSKPTNSPLPVGTVDFCSGTITSHGSGNEYRTFVTMRSGKRVYKKSLDITRTKIYDAEDYFAVHGEISDTNKISILSGGNTQDGRYTKLVVDVEWKAPFQLDVGPQSYTSTDDSKRNYTVSSVTYNYVDITFNYGAKEENLDISNIEFANTIFSRAEWIKNTADYTLRLYLKNTGGMHGWYAEYDSNDNLVFYFLNPHKIETNGSNVNLNGAKIYLDVGHGGKDSGAVGSLNGTKYNESDLNLRLAKKVKAKLEAIGAEVILSRSANSDAPENALVSMERLRNAKADYALAIHHDHSGENASLKGFVSYHYNVFSSQAAKHIYASTYNAGIYKNSNYDGVKYGVKWHMYYTARVGFCPVVLTENGFISNQSELTNIIDDNFDSDRADALVQGIVEYFKSIQ